MFRWLRKRRVKREQGKCAHDYKKIREYTDYDDMHMSLMKIVRLYCPKCNKERRVTEDNWKLFLIKKKIHEEYHSEERADEDRE